MIQYEKIELDYHLPIKLIDIYLEGHLTKTSKHWHNSIEILVPVIGDLRLFLNTKEILISQGSLYIVNSQEIHGMFHSDETDIYKGYALQINYDFIKSLFPQIDNYYFLQPDKMIQKDILKDIFNIIIAYSHDNQFKAVEINSYLLHMLYTLFSSSMCKKQDLPYTIQSQHDKRIIQMTSYIDLHYNENLSINDIADHFQISSGYLSKYFKTHLNMTVKEYISSVRLSHARKDLLFTEYPIIDICYMHGFPNLKSFTHEFKKVYYETPAKYREKMRKQPQ